MEATKSLTTADILKAGKATFTLEGAGRRWTFRVERVESTNPSYTDPTFFVKMLAGPDNENDYIYLGIYQPQHGWMRLTKASKLPETAEPVRAFRWLVSLVFNMQEHLVEANNFRMVWASECQRCGRALTVPSSIDARLGPTCAERMML